MSFGNILEVVTDFLWSAMQIQYQLSAFSSWFGEKIFKYSNDSLSSGDFIFFQRSHQRKLLILTIKSFSVCNANRHVEVRWIKENKSFSRNWIRAVAFPKFKRGEMFALNLSTCVWIDHCKCDPQCFFFIFWMHVASANQIMEWTNQLILCKQIFCTFIWMHPSQ